MDCMAFSAGSQFPPGFRFHPSDQELLIHYLRNKITSSNAMITSIIADVDIYKFNPWDLPEKAFFGEGEWFFFSPRDRKYPNGARPNRAAGSGYWKATGTDKPILATGGSQCLGVKKALVFYKGRPPKGIKTDWVMNEYRLLDANPSLPKKQKGTSMRLDDWVLCRVRQKGSTPTQSEEGPTESSGLTHPMSLVTQNIEKHQLAGNNLYGGHGDYQLLTDILGSHNHDHHRHHHDDDGGGESGCDQNSHGLEFTDSSSVMAFNGCVDAVKPTFSLGAGAIDELMFQTPNKRLRFYNGNGGENDQLSSPSSFYVDQTFPKFF